MKTKIKAIAMSVIAITLIFSGLVTSPAQAASPVVLTVSKTTGLLAPNEAVSLSVTGIPAGQGIYIQQCATNVATPRPTSAVCRSDFADSLWISTNPAVFGMGASNAANVQTLNLQSTFTILGTSYNCEVTQCSLFIRRDHLGGAIDFSLDSVTLLNFTTPTQTPTPTPTQTAVLAATFTNNLRFASGNSQMTQNQKRALRNRSDDYKIASSVVVTATAGRLIGVSDRFVLALAKNRANAIKAYLVAQGVPAEKISMKTNISRNATKPVTRVVANP